LSRRVESTIYEILQGNKVFESVISFFYKALWRITPIIFRLTIIADQGDYRIAYRPFIASDRSITNPAFEERIKKFFVPKPGETVIDIGANIGIYTLMSSRRVIPGGRVIAVEPDESNLLILKKNVEMNNCKNVIIVPVALGTNCGERTFYEGIMPTASSFYPSKMNAFCKIRRERTVKIFTLDMILEKLGVEEVQWIKIDAEKADLEILKGSKSVLGRSKNIKLIIEDSSLETCSYLKGLGYEVIQSMGLAIKSA
jgi:FkbM family methyltransferase